MASPITSPGDAKHAPRAGGTVVGYDRYIDTQLRKTRSQVWSVEVTGAVMTLGAGILAFFLAIATLDYWIVPGGLGFWGRMLALAALVCGSGYYFLRHFVPLLFKRINPVYAAQAIERSKPSLKNSLVNFLLFRSHRETVPDAVYEALEEQAATNLARVPIDVAVDRSHLIRIGYVLLAVVAALALYLVVSPDPLATLGRVVAPWAEIAAPTKTKIIDVQPGDVTAFRGQRLAISAELRGSIEADDVTLFYSSADGQVVDHPVKMHRPADNYRYICDLPPGSAGLQQDLTYRIASGDASTRPFRVAVSAAPTIVVQRLDYEYPKYTGLADQKVEQFGDIKAIEGTEITIHALANQDIKPETAYVDFDCDGRNDQPMTVDGREATATFTLLLKDDRKTPQHARYQLRFTSAGGHENPQPIRYQIEVTPDLAPEIQFLAPKEEEIELPVNGAASLELVANDPDFALRAVTLHAKAGAVGIDKSLLDKVWTGQFSKKYRFDPRKLGLKTGDVVEYWADAEDSKEPKANQTSTARRRIRITSPSNQPQQDQLASKDPQDDRDPNGDKQDQADRPDRDDQPRDEQDAKKGEQDGDPKAGNKQDGSKQNGDKQRDGAPEGDRQQPGDEPGKANDRDKQDKSDGQKGKDAGQKPDGDKKDDAASKNDGDAGDEKQSGKGYAAEKSAANDRNGDKAGSEKKSGDPENKQGEKEDGQKGNNQNGQGDKSATEKRDADKKSAPVPNDGLHDDKVLEEIRKQQDKDGKNSDAKNGDAKNGDAGEDKQPGAEKQDAQQPGKPDPKNAKPQGDEKGKPDKSGDSGDKHDQTADTQNKKLADKQKPHDGAQDQNGEQNASKGNTKQPGAKPSKGQDQKNGAGEPDEKQKGNPGDKQPGAAKPGEGDDPNGVGEKPQGASEGNDPNAKQEAGEPKGPGKQSKPAGDSQKKDATEKPQGAGDKQDKQGKADKQSQQGKDAGENPPGEKADDQKQPGDNASKQGKGAKAKGDAEKDAGKKPSGDKSKPDAKGGDPEDDKGQSGKGSKGSDNEGSPSPQGANQQRPKSAPQSKPSSDQPKDSPKSPSTSEKQSDSQGEQDGDRAGGGKEGGGQSSKQPGTGGAGKNTASDEGAGTSDQQGKGEDSSKAGGDKEAPGKTGQSGEKAGKGSEGKSGKDGAGEAGKGNSPQGKNDPAQGDAQSPADKPGENGGSKPKEGANGSQGGGGKARTGDSPTANQAPHADQADEANLDYARRATDLALTRLKDELAKDQPDQELLDRLGWSRDDLQKFVDRWEKMRAAARQSGAEGTTAKRELNDALRSLGMRPRRTDLKASTAGDQARDLKESRRSSPPPEYSEQYKAYQQGTARGGNK